MNTIIHQLAIGATVCVISLFWSNPVLAKPGGCRGYGPFYGGNYQQRVYEKQSVEDITGQVISVHNITSPRNTSGGVHLIVKTAKEDIDVHLGPAWYINNQNIKINLQDKIRVRGWRISIAGKPAIIAAEVAKGDQVITLRNPDGSPLWSGRERWY
ncbi:MAG: hypothetical protein QNJ51_26640 [Calothrix sp. MO_167.B12]|nr:hypothetical protein [Calothrix sp. MO_167.B12]